MRSSLTLIITLFAGGLASAQVTLDKSTLKVSMDIGTDLAELFRIYPPSSVVTLTIFEGHIDDPDGEFLAVWAGLTRVLQPWEVT